jgi:hypothetical protein
MDDFNNNPEINAFLLTTKVCMCVSVVLGMMVRWASEIVRVGMCACVCVRRYMRVCGCV